MYRIAPNSLSYLAGSALLALVVSGCVGVDDGTGRASQSAQALTQVQDRLLQANGHGWSLAESDAGLVMAAGALKATALMTAGQGISTEVDGVVRGIGVVGETAAASQPEEFNANTVIYPQTAQAASTAFSIAPQDDATVIEAYSIIHDASAPEVYRFAVTLAPGETLQSTGDGIQIVNESGIAIGFAEATWAVDADGRAVPLSLAVDESDLVMTVSHQGGEFAYPIVADPRVVINCGIVTCSAYFSRSLTRSIAHYGVIGAAACGLLGPASVACAAGAGFLLVKAGDCVPKNQCLRLRYTNTSPPAFAGAYCDGSGFCHN